MFSNLKPSFWIHSIPEMIPDDFCDSFTALHLVGLQYDVLNNRDWGGWTTTPPRAYPLRYLVYRNCDDVVATANSLRPIWTYREEMTFVIEGGTSGEYLVFEDIRVEGWKTRVEWVFYLTEGYLLTHS
jgi:hypothetical protein